MLLTFSISESAAGFESVVAATQYFLIFLGFTVFIAHVELLYILRYNNSISLFTLTLRRAGSELLSMGILGGVILLAFGSYMTLAFGSDLLQYSSFTTTVVTLAQASLNKYDYYSVKTAFGKSGSFILTLYLLFISVAAMNFFITLLNVFLEETSDDPEAMKNESEVIDHFMSIVKSFVATESKESNRTRDDHNFEDELDDRLDKQFANIDDDSFENEIDDKRLNDQFDRIDNDSFERESETDSESVKTDSQSENKDTNIEDNKNQT